MKIVILSALKRGTGLNKREAARVLKDIQKRWFNCYAPLNHCMYDQTMTVEKKYKEALKVLLSKQKKRKRDVWQKYYGTYEGDRYMHKTCMDCVSFRDNFFGDWTFETLWEKFSNHMDDCGWQVPEKCLSKVTPAARAEICEMIEKYWENEG